MMLRRTPIAKDGLQRFLATLADAVCVQLLQATPNRADRILRVAKLCTCLGRSRVAYQAIDRLLSIEPNHPGAWEHLFVVLSNADPELAFWIGLRARFGKRIELMVAALEALITVNAQADRLIQILPDPAWPNNITEEFNRILVANSTGCVDEAVQLLRLAIAIEREALASNALKSVSSERPQWDIAKDVVTELVRRWPKTSRAWLEYGRIARDSYDPSYGTADMAFERAADTAEGDALVLEIVAQHFLYELDYAKAAKYFERVFAIDSNAWYNPDTSKNYAMCLKNCGRIDDAARFFTISLERYRAIAENSSGESRELVKRDEAFLLSECGRLEEGVAILRSIRAAASNVSWDYDREEYLAGTRSRLEQLKSLLQSRDLAVLLQGPSFADFATHVKEIADIDFATASLGSFPPVEQQLSSQIGRKIDILMVSHPAMMQAWFPEIEEFLGRSNSNLFLTTRYALSELHKLGISETQFAARHHSRLLYVYPQGGPPLPSRPLHFENGNTLAVLLPALLLGRPKRIFIFGADGGSNPMFNKRLYFYYDDFDSNEPEQDFMRRPNMVSFRGRPELFEVANHRLRVDAINADRVIARALQDLNILFDIPIPPIFNVCLHSTHTLFPRIDCSTAMSMLRSQS
jgi:tetratricopeptide (TPR) repeat protein